MEQHRLSFSTAIKLDGDLAEFINDDGVEIRVAMVDEYHQWLRQHLSNPCLVLVNKRNRYTYTFDAQQEIGSIKEIKAIAFVTYDKASTVVTELLSSIPRARQWNSRTFHDREQALAWLVSQRER